MDRPTLPCVDMKDKRAPDLNTPGFKPGPSGLKVECSKRTTTEQRDNITLADDRVDLQ